MLASQYVGEATSWGCSPSHATCGWMALLFLSLSFQERATDPERPNEIAGTCPISVRKY